METSLPTPICQGLEHHPFVDHFPSYKTLSLTTIRHDSPGQIQPPLSLQAEYHLRPRVSKFHVAEQILFLKNINLLTIDQ